MYSLGILEVWGGVEGDWGVLVNWIGKALGKEWGGVQLETDTHPENSRCPPFPTSAGATANPDLTLSIKASLSLHLPLPLPGSLTLPPLFSSRCRSASPQQVSLKWHFRAAQRPKKRARGGEAPTLLYKLRRKQFGNE